MNGWHRFGILLICCFAIMILFPNHGGMGWPFIGMVVLMWTGAIMLLSLLANVFTLNRYNWFNNLLTLAVTAGILYTLLWYFPQSSHVSPINQLKHGEIPTMDTVKKGIKGLTFNFNFTRRNIHRTENYINQQMPYSDALNRTKNKVRNLQDRVSEQIDMEGY